MNSAICLHRPAQKFSRQRAESTGQSLNLEAQCDLAGGDGPLETTWMSEVLIARTRDVWGRYLEREVGREEAIEMLVNVKRIAMVFYQARQEGANE